MPPSSYVAGQLQVFLVAPQRKAQIAKTKSKSNLLDLTPVLLASSVAQEVPKWDIPYQELHSTIE